MARDPIDHLALLAATQDRFRATIGEVDPTTRVPWCGRWRVRDVVVHLARIHHWAAGQARRRQETPLGRGPFDLDDLYGRCAAELLTTLQGLGPDAESWTLLGNGPASFWHRRQLHETLVHLWDVRAASGLAVDAEAAVWADTVDEVVTVLQPRQARLGRMAPLTAAVHLTATDTPHHWVLGATGTTADRIAVSGPARVLALLLWGRLDPADRVVTDVVTIEGDAGLLADVLGRRLTP